MIKKFYLFILLTQRTSRRFPRALLVGFSVLTVIFLLGLSQLRFLLSVDDLMDTDFKSYPGLQTVRENFDDRNTVFMSIESPIAFDKKFICDLQSWILKMAETKGGEIKAIQKFSKIPIVAVTANVMRGDREKSLEAGCDGYIQKPIDIDTLGQQIERFMIRRDNV